MFRQVIVGDVVVTEVVARVAPASAESNEFFELLKRASEDDDAAEKESS